MKKIKSWFNKPVFTLLSYVLAIFLLGYTLFTVKNSYDYIASLVTAGNVSWGADIKDIFTYFVGNSASYLFYAFSFLFFGKVIDILKPKPIKEEAEEIKEVEEIKEDLVLE